MPNRLCAGAGPKSRVFFCAKGVEILCWAAAVVVAVAEFVVSFYYFGMKKDVPIGASSRRISRRGWIFVCAVFLFSLLFAFALVAGVALTGVRSRRLEAEKLAFVVASQVGAVCGRTFQLNEMVAEMVVSGGRQNAPEGGLDERMAADFSRIAPRLLRDYPAADCVQLAPGGVIRLVEPLDGNEAVIGHDLFGDGGRSAEAELARSSGRLSIGGPYALRQGGEGFIGRLPVFRDVWRTDFWGFVNVVVRVSKILETVDFSELSGRGLRYSVYRIDGETGEVRGILGVGAGELDAPVTAKIDMPNAHWEIAVAPDGSWMNVRLVALVAALSLVLVALATALSVVLLRLRNGAKAASLSGIDPLTGLYTREAALSLLRKEIGYASRNGSQAAVCLVRAEFEEGRGRDGAVVAAADRLLAAVRSEDIVARVGGDEFLVILRGKYTGTDYRPPVARIRGSLSEGRGSFSLGLAVCRDGGDTAESLLKAAEKSLREGI